jgi:chromosome segregation ATPase
VNGRGLTLLNAAGCVVLALLLILQWHKERTLDGRIQDLKASVVAAQDQHAAARERAALLEREQEMLKESVASLQQAAEASGQLLAQREGRIAELETQALALQGQLARQDQQLKTWQAAIAQRDARLRTLNTDLTSARRRLDEAIAKLKAAAAAP